MKAIYTTLNQTEVRQELLRVVNTSSSALSLRTHFKQFGKSAAEVLDVPAFRLLPFLDKVQASTPSFTKDFLIQSKLVAAMNVLTRHKDTSVQSKASFLFTRVRSFWLSTYDGKRQKSSVE